MPVTDGDFIVFHEPSHDTALVDASYFNLARAIAKRALLSDPDRETWLNNVLVDHSSDDNERIVLFINDKEVWSEDIVRAKVQAVLTARAQQPAPVGSHQRYRPKVRGREIDLEQVPDQTSHMPPSHFSWRLRPANLGIPVMHAYRLLAEDFQANWFKQAFPIRRATRGVTKEYVLFTTSREVTYREVKSALTAFFIAVPEVQVPLIDTLGA